MKKRIIDSRVKEKFMVDDAYLNGYAKLCGPYASLVYFSLCRHVNREQVAFPSMAKMAEELDLSRPTIMKGVEALEEWNIVKVKRDKKKNGTWACNRYTLLDKSEWKPKPITASPCQPQIHGDGEKEDLTMTTTDTWQRQPQIHGSVNVVDNKETHIKETHIKVTTLRGEAPKSSYINEDGSIDHGKLFLQYQNPKTPESCVIAWFWELTGVTFKNSQQIQSAYKRSLRAVQRLLLSGYSLMEIRKTLEWCDEMFGVKVGGYGFSLETVEKNLEKAKLVNYQKIVTKNKSYE